MKFTETPLPGVFVLSPEPHQDSRGFFARIWCEEELRGHGLNPRLRQASLSHNIRAGTLRGMHFQAPRAEAKIVGCTAGALFDVVVDLRPESPTFCRWFGTALSRGNRKMIYVPEGCAHGYQTLEDDTDVFYQISEFYSPEQASGVRWDDPAFGIDWPGDVDPLISDKDKAWPLFIKPGPFKTKEATYAAVS